VIDIARHTNVPLEWLLTGFPLPVHSGDGTLVFHPDGRGNTVPLIDVEEAVRTRSDERTEVATPRIPTVYPCGPQAFAVIMPDRSGMPLYEPGDRMVFDPALRIEPGDVVLAAVGPDRIPIIGRISYEIGAKGRRVTVVTPVNPLFAPARSDHARLDVCAALSEHTHPHKTR
jgi:hypothetical protein